jgi:hypothetical protein
LTVTRTSDIVAPASSAVFCKLSPSFSSRCETRLAFSSVSRALLSETLMSSCTFGSPMTWLIDPIISCTPVLSSPMLSVSEAMSDPEFASSWSPSFKSLCSARLAFWVVAEGLGMSSMVADAPRRLCCLIRPCRSAGSGGSAWMSASMMMSSPPTLVATRRTPVTRPTPTPL